MIWIIISSFNLVLMLFFRTNWARQRTNHSRWMSLVVLADLFLVLYLATGRNVLSKIDSQMNPILIFHITVALITVASYFFALYYGIKIIKGEKNYRVHMKWVDRIIVPSRILVLITMLVLKSQT